MRVGQNPAKFVDSVPQPEKVTVALITYIPFLSGYYQQSLDVLKLVLESIWANTDLPYDLMVFDNASCAEVRDYLAEAHSQEKIQYLILSDKNVGKAAAWNHIFAAAPGEYIAYADSDVYFFPGWLSAQVEALETVPNVGMVTGMPMLTPVKFSTATLEWAEAHPEAKLQREQIFPWEDIQRHAISIGISEEQTRQSYEENESVALLYGGRRYYVGAAHFQFTARKEVLQEVLPIPATRPMGQVRRLDEAINQKNFLRLCTENWYVQHMGNTLPGEGFFAQEVDMKALSRRKTAGPKGFWRWRLVRKVLQFLYDRSFEILYRQ